MDNIIGTGTMLDIWRSSMELIHWTGEFEWSNGILKTLSTTLHRQGKFHFFTRSYDLKWCPYHQTLFTMMVLFNCTLYSVSSSKHYPWLMKTLRIKALGELRNVHGCSRSVFVQKLITLVKLINFFLLSFCLLLRVEKKIYHTFYI